MEQNGTRLRCNYHAFMKSQHFFACLFLLTCFQVDIQLFFFNSHVDISSFTNKCMHPNEMNFKLTYQRLFEAF